MFTLISYSDSWFASFWKYLSFLLFRRCRIVLASFLKIPSNSRSVIWFKMSLSSRLEKVYKFGQIKLLHDFCEFRRRPFTSQNLSMSPPGSTPACMGVAATLNSDFIKTLFWYSWRCGTWRCPLSRISDPGRLRALTASSSKFPSRASSTERNRLLGQEIRYD